MPIGVGQEKANQNFAIIMKANFDMESVQMFTATEMKKIEGRVTGKRPGGAGGVYLHGNECHSFSKVVRKDSTLYTASSVNGVNMKATYFNNMGQVKTCNHGYNPVYMNRLNTQQQKTLNQDNAYKSILQHEGIKS